MKKNKESLVKEEKEKVWGRNIERSVDNRGRKKKYIKQWK